MSSNCAKEPTRATNPAEAIVAFTSIPPVPDLEVAHASERADPGFAGRGHCHTRIDECVQDQQFRDQSHLLFRRQRLTAKAHEFLPRADPSDEGPEKTGNVRAGFGVKRSRNVGDHLCEEFGAAGRRTGQRNPHASVLMRIHAFHGEALPFRQGLSRGFRRPCERCEQMLPRFPESGVRR